MKFLLPNYSCLQNPCLGGYYPNSRSLCPVYSTESVEPVLRKKFLFKPLKTPVQFWFQGQLFYKNSTAVLHCHSHGCSRTETSYCLYNEYGIVSHHTFAL